MTEAGQSEQLVRFRINRGVAIVSMSEPPYNALSTRMVEALHSILDRLEDENRPLALVLIGEGGSFSTGAEPEAGAMTDPAEVARLCHRVERWPRPAIAVLTGTALGTGAELALAAHVRLATPGARIGLPDIALGLPPRAGGSQRLTLIAGPDVALKLILTGRAASAEAAHAAGLVDGVIAEGDPYAAAHALAIRLMDEGDTPKPARDMTHRFASGTRNLSQVAEARNALPETAAYASRRIVDCVEAAVLLPFDAGCAFEAEAFAECRDHAQSRALRHLFLAERRISPLLLLADDAGQRRIQDQGKQVVSALKAAQARAIGWLTGSGVSEDQIDQAFVARGFETGPGGGSGAGTKPVADVWPRILGALVAEGGRQLQSGQVARTADLDALAVWGLGWPRRLGGPMIAAEIAGLPGFVRDLKGWMHEERVWAPPPPVIAASQVAGGFATLPITRG